MSNSDLKPLISIILAAHNEGLYIAECLDSIINQTYQNWELIAVDDHSTDNTLQIIKEYAQKDHRIKVHSSNRKKLIPTLKYGYQFATGTLINRMDADDKMPPYKLNVLYDEWKMHGIGHVASGSCEHFVDDGEVGAGFKRYDAWIQHIAKTNRFWEEIYLECTLQSNCWLMHRTDFEAAGGFEPEVYPEDYDLAFRLYKNGMQIHGIDQITHLWRDHSERISRNWESYKDNRYFELKLKYFLELDFNSSRPLIIWGAGTNGKDLVKLFQKEDINPIWVCDNRKKIGRNIYGITMQNTAYIEMYINPQIIVAVSSPSDKREITKHLENLAVDFDMNYWFWS